MAIEPVKIPQNVYIEDRIIGPITLRQIMLVMISGGLSYGIWAAMRASYGDSPVVTGLSWSPLLIGILYAFVKVNDISMFRLTLLMLEKVEKPARRTWSPRRGVYVNIVTTGPKKSANEDIQKSLAEKEKTEIDQLSELLDRGPDEMTEEIESMPDIEDDKPTKPVKRNRVQVDELERPVDDVSPTKEDDPEESSAGSGLIRDIAPPTA